jgi:hypothetical protein
MLLTCTAHLGPAAITSPKSMCWKNYCVAHSGTPSSLGGSRRPLMRGWLTSSAGRGLILTLCGRGRGDRGFCRSDRTPFVGPPRERGCGGCDSREVTVPDGRTPWRADAACRRGGASGASAVERR